MFTSGLEECRSNTVVINNIDGCILKLVVDFMYTSKIRISTENVQNLIIAACLFQLERLQRECEEFIVYHLDADNCVGSYMLADIYNLQRVKEKAMFLMLQQFTDIVRNDTYLDLTFHQLVSYFKMDKLCVRSEDEVFDAVVHWLDHKSDGPDFEHSGSETLQYVDALDSVRFSFMSADLLRTKCLNNRYAQHDSIQSKLNQILAQIQLTGISDETEVSVAKRCGDSGRLVMYDENDFVYYNPLKDMWEPFCACPEEVVTTTAFVDAAVFGHRVCAVEEGLLLTGET